MVGGVGVTSFLPCANCHDVDVEMMTFMSPYSSCAQ